MNEKEVSTEQRLVEEGKIPLKEATNPTNEIVDCYILHPDLFQSLVKYIGGRPAQESSNIFQALSQIQLSKIEIKKQ